MLFMYLNILFWLILGFFVVTFIVAMWFKAKGERRIIMVVHNKLNLRMLPYGILNMGDTFIYADKIYIKTNDLLDGNTIAVNLETGCCRTFDFAETVVKVNTEIYTKEDSH